RDRGGVIGGSSMIGRRTVAIFALHPGQVGGVGKNSVLVGETESAWQTIANCVAGQARTVGLAAGGLERRTAEGAGVGRVRHVLADAQMTREADLQAGIFWRRTGDV